MKFSVDLPGQIVCKLITPITEHAFSEINIIKWEEDVGMWTLTITGDDSNPLHCEFIKTMLDTHPCAAKRKD